MTKIAFETSSAMICSSVNSVFSPEGDTVTLDHPFKFKSQVEKL